MFIKLSESQVSLKHRDVIILEKDHYETHDCYPEADKVRPDIHGLIMTVKETRKRQAPGIIIDPIACLYVIIVAMALRDILQNPNIRSFSIWSLNV